LFDACDAWTRWNAYRALAFEPYGMGQYQLGEAPAAIKRGIVPIALRARMTKRQPPRGAHSCPRWVGISVGAGFVATQLPGGLFC
jgi:hypothetical protein